MIEKTANIISWLLWAIFLFVLWGILSFAQGMEGQWWSMFSLNPELSSPWNLDITYIRMFIFACLSIIVAYFINHFLGKQKK